MSRRKPTKCLECRESPTGACRRHRDLPDPICPQCGGLLAIVTDGMIGRTIAPPFYVPGRPLEVRMMPAVFAACCECEFCIEIDTKS